MGIQINTYISDSSKKTMEKWYFLRIVILEVQGTGTEIRLTRIYIVLNM